MAEDPAGGGAAAARGEPPAAYTPCETVRVSAAVARLAAVLAGAGIAEAQAEARDLVAAVLDVPRFWPSLHRDAELDADVWAAAQCAAARRATGAPFAYAVGSAPFRHLTLAVDERVLIPRQETELLVDLVLARVAPGGSCIDVGTGSGAIALALASEGRFDRVGASDVSLDALAVAGANAARLGGALRVPVELRHGADLAPWAGERARCIVSNPPYIAYHESAALPALVRDWEPAVALYSGDGGMRTTARLVRDAAALLEPGGLLAVELDSRRAVLAAELAATDGRYDGVEIRLDLAGRERFLLARRVG